LTRFFATLALACLLPAAALAEAPKRDLTIELRQVREGQENADTAGGAYTVGTASRSADFAPQQVRVRNGEKASLAMNQSMPMQWVQKIESQSATLTAGGTSASSSSGGVTQAVTWMESGQNLSVTPHWAGGKQPAKLDIEMLAAVVDERTSSDLPATNRQRVSTTITAPLQQWVTIASSGKPARPGSYSSAGSSEGRTLVQIRVTPN
jgi:hypothetical protein